MKRTVLFLSVAVWTFLVLAGCSGGKSTGWTKPTKTPTPTPTPNPAFQIFEELNNAADENLESIWQSCQSKIAERYLQNEWNILCNELSALMDYQGSELSRLRDEYGLSLFANNSMYFDWRPRTTDARIYMTPSVKEGKIKPAVAELLYRPGFMPDMGGTLWLYEEYKAVEETLKQPTERTAGTPIRVLIVDCSETIENVPINRELFAANSNNSKKVVGRSENLFSALFHGAAEKLRPVSYPELADIVVKITVTYPFKGAYSVNYGSGYVKVWNTDVTITAVNRWTGEAVEAYFSNKAPQSLVLSNVHDDYFMDIPRLKDDSRFTDDAKRLAQDILAWFPDVK